MGPALWAAMVGFAAWCSFVPRIPEMHMFVLDPEPEILVSFALSSLSVAWLLRATIASANVRSAVWISLISSVLGGALYMLFFLAVLLVTGQEGSEGGVGTTIAGTLSGMLLGAMFSFFFWPVTLPVGWASVLLLRQASGGLSARSAS